MHKEEKKGQFLSNYMHSPGTVSETRIMARVKSFVLTSASLSCDSCVPLTTLLPSFEQTFALMQPHGVPLQRAEPAES